MLESQKERLQNKNNRYLSIGITLGGKPRTSIGIPWESTAHAYNMRTPDVYLSPEDLQDEHILECLKAYTVVGCYIWAPLEDYSFLSSFKELQDINIKNGDSIRDLDFLSGLSECDMLFLQNAKLKNLNRIVDMKKSGKKLFGGLRCVGLDNCEIEDLSIFETEQVQFSEFLVWKPQGSNERDRWNVISASKRKYYEFVV